MKLIKLKDQRLREPSPVCGNISKKVRKVGEFLLSQLEPLESIGLAAPQFGQMMRIIVVQRDKLPALIVVDPRIVHTKGSFKLVEQCKSIPDSYYAVTRAHSIIVAGLNLDGYKVRFSGEGIYTAVIQHEIDHLDGTMIDEIGKPVVAIICSWCKALLRYEDWGGETGASHGICKKCLKKERKRG